MASRWLTWTGPPPRADRRSPAGRAGCCCSSTACSRWPRPAVKEHLATKFHDAPTAYLLSAAAAIIYIAAFVALVRHARAIAVVACSVELVGVLIVGTVSYLVPHDFPDATVWSGYGSGYGYLPAVLPILALIWLRRVPSPRA